MVCITVYHIVSIRESHLARYSVRMAGNKGDQIYDQLRSDILKGALAPGSSLSALGVAERFSASRTPVRQAFLRLEADGLVSLIDRQGARVAPISLQGVRDLFELRMLLEAHAARVVAESAAADPAVRERFVELLAGFDAVADDTDAADRRDRFYELAEAFDQAVIATTRNRHLARSIAELRPHSARLRMIAHSPATRLESSLVEHRAMCRAIIDGQGDAAAAAVTEHLVATERTILEAVMSPGASAVAVDLVGR